MRRSKRCAVVGRTPNYGNVWRARATEDRGRGGGEGENIVAKKEEKEKGCSSGGSSGICRPRSCGLSPCSQCCARANCRSRCLPAVLYPLPLLFIGFARGSFILCAGVVVIGVGGSGSPPLEMRKALMCPPFSLCSPCVALPFLYDPRGLTDSSPTV